VCATANEPFSQHLVAHKNTLEKNSKHVVAGPLMCWDFFMEGHFRRMQQAESYVQLRQFAQAHQWRIDWNMKKLILAEQRVVLVTDPAQIIQFASANMIGMNGYVPEEVIGKQPKIFQGADTDPEIRNQLREAIIRRIPFKGNILNYRKDGTPYNCLVEEYPVWNRSGVLVNFIAFEKIA
jgi:PAS domain-containing protein